MKPEVNGKALDWISNLFTSSTQRITVAICFAMDLSLNTIFYVIQLSELGSFLYDVREDSLLTSQTLERITFADDLKFFVDVAFHSQQVVQGYLNRVAHRSDAHHLPRSVENYAVQRIAIIINPIATVNMDGMPFSGRQRSG